MKYPSRFTFRTDDETIRKLKSLAEKDQSSAGRVLRILIDQAYKDMRRQKVVVTSK